MKAKVNYIFAIGIRNVFRYTRRTLITAFSIAIAVTVYLYMSTMLNGLNNISKINIVTYETSSYRFTTQKYWDEKNYLPVEYFIPGTDKILSALRKAGITATKRTTLNAKLYVYQDPYPADGTFPVQLQAIDPAFDNAVYPIKRYVMPGGKFIKSGEDTAVIGQQLADDLGAKVGYPMTFTFTDAYGTEQSIDLTIAGIIRTPDDMINRTAVYTSYKTLDGYTGTSGNGTEIDTRLPSESSHYTKKVHKIGLAAFQTIPKDQRNNNMQLLGLGWKDIATTYVAVSSMDKAILGVILILIAIIGLIGISNTMTMAIMERKYETAVMRSFGFANNEIRTTFLIEGSFVGLVGGIIGDILGFLLALPLVIRGWDMSDLVNKIDYQDGADMGYRIPAVIHGMYSPISFLITVIVALGFGLLITLFVTRSICKYEVAHALNSRSR